MEFITNLKFFISCFIKATTEHKFRSISLVLYFSIYYLICFPGVLPERHHDLFIASKSLGLYWFPLLSITALFASIDSTIRLIITIPIRNTAIRIARNRYLHSVMQFNSPSIDLGQIYAIFKRIENIFTGLEREIANIIKYLPLYIVSFIAMTEDSQSKVKVIAVILVNLCAIFYANSWYKIRKKAFKADEEMGTDVLNILHNIDRTQVSNHLELLVNKTIKHENTAYVNSLLAKQYYKLFLSVINILSGFYLVSNITQKPGKYISGEPYFLLVCLLAFNWVQLSSAIISMFGISSGMPKISKIKVRKSEAKDILISNLTVPGVFNNISLQLKYGDRLVISGDNGTGKTFLLKILSGQIVPNISSKYMLVNGNSSPFNEEKHQLRSNQIWQEHFAKYNSLLIDNYLSTGQNAFLSISLALLYQPSLLLIDESLDSMSDTLLNDAFELFNLLKCSIVVASHRDDIIKKFPRHIVIANQILNDV